jgi:hypothetical protein
MKAEERKHLERNELADRLKTVWQNLSANSTAVTVIWGVILLGLVGLIGYRYYSRSTAQTRSELWYRMSRATDVDDLQTVISDAKGSDAGVVARYHLTRYQFMDALSRLAGPNSEERVKAAETLEEIKTRYGELAKETSDQPVLAQEALMGVAKAEEVLAGVPTAGDPAKMRGSLARAAELYDEVAKKYPKSFLGEQAAKRAGEIRDHPAQFEAFYTALSQVHAKTPPAATPPPLPTPPDPIIPPTPAPGPNLPEAPKAVPPAGEAPKQ